MVDCETQVIVAQAITTDANDKQQLELMLECCDAVHGELPEKLLADAGYWSTANAQLGDDQTELFVATTKDQQRRKELRDKDPPRGQIPGGIWTERAHGAEVANQARAANLSKTKYVDRTGVWSTRQPRLRQLPVTRDDWCLRRMVLVLGNAQPAEIVAVRPGAGQPRCSRSDR